METKTAWSGFAGRKWKEDVDVRDFIQKNYERTTVMSAFWQTRQKRQKSYG